MHKAQEQVAEFHRAFDIHIGMCPGDYDDACSNLRQVLIGEEFQELCHALNTDDLIGIADGLADLLYVVYGTAVSCGIDIEPIFDEVHRSNMTKVGGHKREDGKWIKPDTYEPANLKPILDGQLLRDNS